MKRTPLRRRSVNKPEKEKGRSMSEFFLQLWDEREIDEDGYRFVRCFETGREMPRNKYRKLSICYSHILPKETYPEYAFLEENVQIVLPQEHHQYEMNQEMAPRQYELKHVLLKKHSLGTLNK